MSGEPLTSMRFLLSQHTTRSPPSPMTRLTRLSSASEGSNPTQVSAVRTAPVTPPTGTAGGSQPPGSAKTTMSPRCTSPPVSLDARIRSCSCSVGSIDPLGT